MKRILALLLAVSMMTVSVNTIAATDNQAEESGREYAYSYEEDAVIQLGLMETELSGDFVSNTEATRMDLVVALYRALNYQNRNEQPVAVKSYYKDVDSLHYAAGYLSALTDLGIVGGYPDGTFRPNDVVTLKDAYVMCLRSLGYFRNESAEETQVYRVAKQLGLDTKMSKSGNDILSRGDIAIVLYNMLFADYYDVLLVNAFGQGLVPKECFLTQIMDLSYEKGIIQEIGGVSLYDRFPENDQFLINDKMLKNHLDFNDAYLGYKATVIYNDETLETVAVIFPKENNVVTIDTELLVGYSNKTYRYYRSETATKVTNATLEQTADILYNNYVCLDSTRMMPNYGKVVLIDNDDDNVFEVAKVYEYKNDLIENVLKGEEDFEICLKNSKQNIKLSDYEKYRIFSDAGTEIKPTSIKINSLASVCEADDNVITIYISNTTVVGNFTYIRKGTGSKNTILGMEDGSEYSLLKNAYLQGWNGTSPGQLKLYLDFNGYVAAVMLVVGGVDGTSNSGWKYGYIFKSAFDNEAFNESLRIKLLSQNNEMLYLDIENKVYIDGVLYKNMEYANDAIWNAYGQFQDENSAGKERVTVRLIRYYQNESGAVTKLDTPIEQSLYDSQTPTGYNENDCLMLRAKGKMLAKRLGIRSFKTTSNSNAEVLGEINFADANRTVFIIPATIDGTEKDEDYIATTIGNVSSIRERNYYVSGYNTSPEELYTDVAVIRSGLAINDIYKIAVVSEICQTLDDEGNVRDAVAAYFDGGKCVEYCVKDTSAVAVETLKSGDVIQYYLESGEIVVEQLLYRYGGEGVLNSSSTNADGEAGAEGGGLSLNGNVSVISKVHRRTESWLNVEGPKQLPILIPLFSNIQFYDIQNDEAYVGTSWDIRTVDQYGERADIFIYSFNGYNPVDAVAIRISK